MTARKSLPASGIRLSELLADVAVVVQRDDRRITGITLLIVWWPYQRPDPVDTILIGHIVSIHISCIRILDGLVRGDAADARGILLGGVVNSTQNSNYVSGDASALREIFSNLLENAVKHNGHGTEITAEVKQESGNLLVRVSDTGKGIPKKILTNLFEKANPNYRPKTTSGTGMGLYLCRLLVELHGGSITANAAEGKGTEFRVLLPLRRTTPG